MHPELKSKNDKLLEFCFSLYIFLAFIFRVLDTFNFYLSDSIIHPLIPMILHGACFLLASISIYRWFTIVSIQQNKRFIHFNELKIDEIITIFYVVPYLTQNIAFIWNISNGETHWRDRNENSLIVQVILVYFFYLIIIRKSGWFLLSLKVINRLITFPLSFIRVQLFLVAWCILSQ